MTQATRQSEVAGKLAGAGRRLPKVADDKRGRAVHPVEDCTRVLPARQELVGSNGKVCAWVADDCLCKTLDGSRHFLQKPAGIAFDAAILAQAQDLGAVRVWVKDRETGATYRAALDAFDKNGVRLNRGFGPQVCLPFVFWQTQQPGAPVQLALW